LFKFVKEYINRNWG